MKKLLKSLSETEYLLVRATSRENLDGLDEDALIELHNRVRKARNKHVKMYRREAAEAVTDKASRAAGRRTTSKNAARAEVFEAALARVSRRLGAVAKASAAELKRTRLDRARKDAPSFAGDGSDPAGRAPARLNGKKKQKSAGRKKREASDIAAGARRQAKRDG